MKENCAANILGITLLQDTSVNKSQNNCMMLDDSFAFVARIDERKGMAVGEKSKSYNQNNSNYKINVFRKK